MEQTLKEYYRLYDEENRLQKDKAHKLEFLTTIRYIDKYLRPQDRILEVGAGTGAYSLYYAQQGYQVDALELVDENIAIFESKITKDMNIRIQQGTATNLSCYEDETFDMTLVLGPMYHLFHEEDKNKAIMEALRVTKKGGMLYFAYITNETMMISYVLKKHHLLDKNLFDKNYKFLDNPEKIFSASRVDEFENRMKRYPIDKITSVMADGVSPCMIKEDVNHLTDEEFLVWLDYHFSICEKEELQGYSNHVLYIGKKRCKD